MAGSSQKFIARNRAPRVQIEYDVELYGAEKKVQLPFVMGVMADLAGKPVQALPPVDDRKFLEIDVDNFDARMRAMAPRVAFSVPNTLTGEGQLSVDITFAGMDDFSPAAIARQVEPLRKLLEARTELSNLLTYMDGKTGAEELIERFLQDPSVLAALAADRPSAPDNAAEALAALRAAQPVERAEPDEAAAALAALRAAQPVQTEKPDEAATALAALRAQQPVASDAPDTAAAALDALRAAQPIAGAKPDTAAAAFAALRASQPVVAEEANASAAALDALRATQPAAEPAQDEAAAALAALRAAQPAPVVEPDASSAALAALRAAHPIAEAKPDDAADALAGLRAAQPVVSAEPDSTRTAFDALRAAQPAVEARTDASAAALDALRAAQPAAGPEADTSTAALDALRAAQPVANAEPDAAEAALDALRTSQPAVEEAADTSTSAFAALRSAQATAETGPDTSAAAALDALRAIQPVAEVDPDGSAAALDALRAARPVAEVEPDPLGGLDDLLSVTEEPTDKSDPLADLLSDEPEVIAAEADPLGDLDDLLDVGADSEGPDPLADLLAEDPAEAMEPDPLGDLDDLFPVEPEAAEEPDPLADLLTDEPVEAIEPDPLGDLDDLLADELDAAEDPDPLADLLAEDPVEAAEPDPLGDLDDMLAAEPEAAEEADPLADLLAEDPVEATEPDPFGNLDDLLAGEPEAMEDPDPLADLPAEDLVEAAEPDALGDLDDLLAGEPETAEADPLGELDDLLADEPATAANPDPLADLEALLAAPLELPADDPLAGLDDPLAPVAAEEDPLAGLDALLANPPPPAEDPLAGLADLLASPDAMGDADPLADLDALLAPLSASGAAGSAAVPSQPAPPPVYGTISAPAPAPDRLQRPIFRMAVFGDFTGRAASGRIETGEALAARRAIPFDVDTVEDVIESFATTLVLPIGPEGRGIAVELAGLDSLHPDELVESVEVFSELKGLRQRLSSSAMAAKAVEEMKGWGASFFTPLAPTSGRSGAASIPADRRLSDFQRLIGDREGKLTQASPAADFIGQIVGPHVVPGPNPEARALRDGVDAAMASAMRLVLHHPEFQAIEAQWRSLDLMARRIETDVKLRIHLYDISAEELAADLATHDDLAQSGFYKLVNAPLNEDGETGFSALFGLYTFEETPPHADLLGRIATVASHVQAPFFAAMAPAFLDVALKDRHPLIEKAWATLRSDPVSKWLGMASPRFLLRRPYGARSEPIDAFDFEEFTMSEGLSGMLWGNPVVLVAVLLAEAWKQGGPKMELGKIMSVDDMPFHYATDRYGDQVPLPCTERNVTTEKIDRAAGRGFMPLVAPKARNEVRLASFRSVAGDPILGPWSGVQPASVRSAVQPQLQVSIPATPAAAAAAEDDLDSLLAGFGETTAATDPNSIDADLAALLEGL